MTDAAGTSNTARITGSAKRGTASATHSDTALSLSGPSHTGHGSVNGQAAYRQAATIGNGVLSVSHAGSLHATFVEDIEVSLENWAATRGESDPFKETSINLQSTSYSLHITELSNQRHNTPPFPKPNIHPQCPFYIHSTPTYPRCGTRRTSYRHFPQYDRTIL